MPQPEQDKYSQQPLPQFDRDVICDSKTIAGSDLVAVLGLYTCSFPINTEEVGRSIVTELERYRIDIDESKVEITLDVYVEKGVLHIEVQDLSTIDDSHEDSIYDIIPVIIPNSIYSDNFYSESSVPEISGVFYQRDIANLSSSNWGTDIVCNFKAFIVSIPMGDDSATYVQRQRKMSDRIEYLQTFYRVLFSPDNDYAQTHRINITPKVWFLNPSLDNIEDEAFSFDDVIYDFALILRLLAEPSATESERAAFGDLPLCAMSCMYLNFREKATSIPALRTCVRYGFFQEQASFLLHHLEDSSEETVNFLFEELEELLAGKDDEGFNSLLKNVLNYGYMHLKTMEIVVQKLCRFPPEIQIEDKISSLELEDGPLNYFLDQLQS
jgi:hypothetical protein